MARSKAIFEWIFGLGNNGYHLNFLASQNTGLDEAVLHARKEKEQKSLEAIAVLKETYPTLEKVWSFLNEHHDLYTANKLVERGRATTISHDVSELARNSYG